MRILVSALGVVSAGALWGQSHFNWQNYCFDHPAAPFCQGHDYAIKKPAPTKDAQPRSVIRNPLSSAPVAAPALIAVGAIDWRFADPRADTLAGFNVSGLSASPLAGGLIAELGARQGLSEADLERIFDELANLDQVAISVRDNQMVAMITGPVADLTLAPAQWKTLTISGSALLVGQAEAVDQAARRIAMKVPAAEITRSADQRQASNEFWAIGPAMLVGPEAVSAGVQCFSVNVSVRDRFASDVAFEFTGTPNASPLRGWLMTPGSAALDGNTVHFRSAIESADAKQKLGQVAASALGQRLAELVAAVRVLPARETAGSKPAKPVIYGLDGGPREVK